MDLNAANRDLKTFSERLRDSRGFVTFLKVDTMRMSEWLQRSTKSAGTLGTVTRHQLETVKALNLARGQEARQMLSTLKHQQDMLAKQHAFQERKLIGEEDLGRIDSISRVLTHIEGKMAVNEQQMGKLRLQSSGVVTNFKDVVTIGTLAGTALAKAVGFTGDWNKALIEVNSSAQERNRILRDALDASVAIGAETASMQNIFKGLISEGFEFGTDLRQTAMTAGMLEKALGQSVDSTVRLAVAARGTRTEYSQLADSVARIVNLTAVSADEAERYATAISKSAIGARQFSGAAPVNLPALTETLSALASNLKGTLADPKEIEQLIPRLTRLQDLGSLGMGILGTGGPGFLAGEGGQKRLESVLANLSKLGDQAGPSLEMWAQQFGMTTTTLNVLAEKYREQGANLFRLNDEQKTQNALQNRYEEQLRQTNEVVGMLWRQGSALLMNVLQPAVSVVRVFAGWLQKLNGMFMGMNKFLGGVPAAVISGAVFVTFAAALLKLTVMATGASASIDRLTMRLLRLGGTAEFSPLGSRGGLGRLVGAGMRPLLGRLALLFTRFLGPIALLATPLLALNSYFKREERRMNEIRLRDVPKTSKSQEIDDLVGRVMKEMSGPGADMVRVRGQFEAFERIIVAKRALGVADMQKIAQDFTQQLKLEVSSEARKAQLAGSFDERLAAESMRNQEAMLANGEVLAELVKNLNLAIVERNKVNLIRGMNQEQREHALRSLEFNERQNAD